MTHGKYIDGKVVITLSVAYLLKLNKDLLLLFCVGIVLAIFDQIDRYHYWHTISNVFCNKM